MSLESMQRYVQDLQGLVERQIQEGTAKRAYEIWEREGRQQGKDQEYWYRAIYELNLESYKDGDYS